MKILISGGHGFIGNALTARLETDGHKVSWLTRRPSEPNTHHEIFWDPDAGKIDEKELVDYEAVVHLAGDGIADGRWTEAKKKRIRESRIMGTHLLSQTLARLPNPPKVLISGSAIGFYGDRGDESLTEASSSGQGFLAEVCREWEGATQPAKEKGIRVAFARTGIVLGTRGGALPKMLTPFKWGVGGNLGSGTQYMSWITLEDEVKAIVFAIGNKTISGPFNITSPHPVTNAVFTQTLGRVLHRPTILPAPAFALRLAIGEMADALLLSSTRVLPEKLLQAGYKFRHPNLEEGLRSVIE